MPATHISLVHCPRCQCTDLDMRSESNGIIVSRCNGCDTEFSVAPPKVPESLKRQSK